MPLNGTILLVEDNENDVLLTKIALKKARLGNPLRVVRDGEEVIAYLGVVDPAISTRTWQTPMDEITKSKIGSTLERCERVMQDKAFDSVRNVPILETTAAHFLKILETGSVATHVFLR